MARITDIHNPWRDSWQPASFRGAGFHVEVNSKASGRRNVVHEFPKRDLPYTEDMGRKARRFSVQGYLVGPNYKDQRDRLEAACDREGPGSLVLPTFREMEVICDSFSIQESREKGGYCQFDMVFVEEGKAADASPGDDTSKNVETAANNNDTVATDSYNNSANTPTNPAPPSPSGGGRAPGPI